jgi:hypothetical protein
VIVLLQLLLGNQYQVLPVLMNPAIFFAGIRVDRRWGHQLSPCPLDLAPVLRALFALKDKFFRGVTQYIVMGVVISGPHQWTAE